MTASRLRTAGFVLVALGVFLLARAVQETGHSWGDDFAMYVNQASGLVDGTADRVVADNEFALDNSAFRFGPVAYPWGFPALLAPILAVTDLDYDALKLVGTAALAIGTVALFVLADRRLRTWQAAIVAGLVGLNSWYLGWTDAVLSDLPFWCAVMLTLVLIDRRVEADDLLDATARTRLVLLGLAIAATFSIRREGGILVVALAATQLGALWRQRGDERSHGERLRIAAVPHLSFAVATALVQFARPAPLLTTNDAFGPTGLRNLGTNLRFYRSSLSELLGLKDGGPNDVALLGSPSLGTALLALVLGAAVIGIVVSVVRTPGRDLHVVVVTLGIAAAILVQPFRESRYLYTLFPLVLLFAMLGLASLAAGVAGVFTSSEDRKPGDQGKPGEPDEHGDDTRDPRSRWARALALFPAVVALPFVLAIGSDTLRSVDYHDEYDYTHWGPVDPASLELWDAVTRLTDQRDVVVFHQARSMNLHTSRLAIQGNSVPMMLERGDWYAMVRYSDYLQTRLDDPALAAELGFVAVWENERFVLWKIPDRPVVPIEVTAPPAG